MENINPGVKKYMGTLIKTAIKHRRKGILRPFLVGHFITNRCMCNCASCLWKHNDWEEVPLNELKRFYTEAKEEGFLAAAISGGEPFLRKDLGEFLKFIHGLDFAVMLFTTGWFLKERMDEILPYVTMLMLSLDSAKAERYDEMRGLPGLFGKLMNNVDLLKQKYPDKSAQFNCCVKKGIEEEIDDLIKLTEQKQMRISFDVITPYRHGDEDSHFTETDESLPIEDLQRVCAYLLKKKKEGAPILNSEMYFQYFVDGKLGYKCHNPKLAMLVDGRGNVEDCLNLDKPIANILDMPLKEIMELPRFKQTRIDAENCSSCNSPAMVDLSHVWEDPDILLRQGGFLL